MGQQITMVLNRRRSKHTYKLQRGPNEIDQILAVSNQLIKIENAVSRITADTSRELLCELRIKIMKLCNPARQGITEIQRLKAGDIRDEFHAKLCKFGIPRWWKE